jgi:hypothetical protein
VLDDASFGRAAVGIATAMSALAPVDRAVDVLSGLGARPAAV